MLNTSEVTTKQAFSRMLINEEHKWAAYADDEVRFVIKTCKINKRHKLLDVGCGIGRHSNAFAEKGYFITGIDYVESFIKRANAVRGKRKLGPLFINADFRTFSFKRQFDFVICLYDVIGSSIDNENNNIVRAIHRCLQPNGKALISVMNYDYSAYRATPENYFVFEYEHDKLLDLVASDTMERTGNIFNHKYLLIDSQTRITYRKERFRSDAGSPTEVIVKDRRYTKDEIVKICEENGFTVLWSRYVKAGNWSEKENNIFDSKEILLFCEKKEGR